MNNIEEICQKFSSLKKLLNKSYIDQICHQPFKSISKEIRGSLEYDSSANNLELNMKNNPINSYFNKSNSKNDDCFKNLLISLESSKKEKKNNTNEKNTKNNDNSPKNEKSRSPSINSKDNSPKIIDENENIDKLEKEIFNELKGKTIPLNEDEEENNETCSHKNKYNKSLNKIKSNNSIINYPYYQKQFLR